MKYETTPKLPTMKILETNNRKYVMLLRIATVEMFLINKLSASFADQQKFLPYIAVMM